jgi:hypothetical protein
MDKMSNLLFWCSTNGLPAAEEEDLGNVVSPVLPVLVRGPKAMMRFGPRAGKPVARSNRATRTMIWTEFGEQARRAGIGRLFL